MRTWTLWLSAVVSSASPGLAVKLASWKLKSFSHFTCCHLITSTLITSTTCTNYSVHAPLHNLLTHASGTFTHGLKSSSGQLVWCEKTCSLWQRRHKNDQKKSEKLARKLTLGKCSVAAHLPSVSFLASFSDFFWLFLWRLCHKEQVFSHNTNWPELDLRPCQ